MARILVPRDSREQLSSMQVVVGHLDGNLPALGSAWQRVNQDSYVLAPPAPRRMAPSVDGGSGPAEEAAEEPGKRDAAHVLWPGMK
jgi:hypothetical protein